MVPQWPLFIRIPAARIPSIPSFVKPLRKKSLPIERGSARVHRWGNEKEKPLYRATTHEEGGSDRGEGGRSGLLEEDGEVAEVGEEEEKSRKLNI